MKHKKTRRIATAFQAVLAAILCMNPAADAIADQQGKYSFDYSYLSSINHETVHDYFTFSDEWFDDQPEVRNDQLGLASARMAAISQDGEIMVETLKQLGFSDAVARRFSGDEKRDCAYTIGTKQIVRDRKPVLLIAVVFQGRDYGIKGWLQNVTVDIEDYESVDHDSYAIAAEIFLADLEEMNIPDDSVFWICGLSRAGAIANLVSARFLEKEESPAVFCYTFESPATTMNEMAHDKKYQCIHNYICEDDPVIRVPPWGMTRYGQDHTFNTIPLKDVKEAVSCQNPQAWDYLMSIDEDTFMNKTATSLNNLTGALEKMIPTREDYSKMIRLEPVDGRPVQYSRQEGLQALCQIALRQKEKIRYDIKERMIDLTSQIIESRREDLHNSDPVSSVIRMQERWEMAGRITHYIHLLAWDDIEKESIYALLELLDFILAADEVDSSNATEQAEEIYDSMIESEDPAGILNSLISGETDILFSHRVDVILARMRILAGDL